MSIKIQEYFQKKKELYDNLLAFLENCDENDENFTTLIENINSHQIQSNIKEFAHFLRLVAKISNNHHRFPGFNEKIEKIINYFRNDLKQIFSNFNFCNIFKDNKSILVFLLEKEIITIDKTMYNFIENTFEKNGTKYFDFFLPELKKVTVNDEKKAEEIDEKIKSYKNYEEKRKIGENDTYICTLIRQDAVKEFISYVNSKNLSLFSTIERSSFETNPFLISKEPTLIEYAAFFGSIQIFRYLMLNKVPLESSLWLYAIHSNNADMIQLLEDEHVKLPEDSYVKCIKESIKCHHNEFAEYFMNKIDNYKENEEIVKCSFHNYNYYYFPDDLNQDYLFFYYCRYIYTNIVDFYLESRKNEIEKYEKIRKRNISKNE